MATIRGTSAQLCPASTATTLHTGPGQLHAILAAADITTGNAVILFYDGDTPASDPQLCQICLSPQSPNVFVQYSELRPLRFVNGLTVVCDANTVCHVQTVA
jgi:hypothetical protein